MACKYQYNNQWYSKEELVNKLSQENSNFKTLYNNLVNEITNTETGRKILDRIKRDYVNKNQYNKEDFSIQEEEQFYINEGKRIKRFTVLNNKNPYAAQTIFKNIEDAKKELEKLSAIQPYTLEEQQEEAVVELLGLMTAEKLDKVKDGKLISLLKRLLKEMKQFVRNLLNSKEIYIENLPDNMTLGDIADILAYSNSKLILDGYTVEYSTPDNQQFKTYAEASNHISELAKNVKEVDLYNLTFKTEEDSYSYYYMDRWFDTLEKAEEYKKELNVDTLDVIEKKKTHTGIKEFLVKNKEYEQSKEIIEEWKKINNIQYNPEEIYSRGQEFSSVVGAYSNFDVNLMMQNLLAHIEDNEKAGGKFAISAYTKPVDKQIGHLEGGGGKIKFKIYPKSEDILWASNIDVYSGSTTISGMSASEAVSNKSPELVGVSFLKYPTLYNISSIQPNLAAIVDDLAHHHNELAIALNFTNFELEYDNDIDYQTKKIINSINKILEQKRNGKLVKPEINKITTIPNTFEYWQQDMNEDGGIDRFRILISKKENKWFEEFFDTYGQSESIREISYKEVERQFNEALSANSTLTKNIGIQPTQTASTLKESIDSIKNKNTSIKDNQWAVEPFAEGEYAVYTYLGKFVEGQPIFNSIEEANKWLKENQPKQKEYTSQALINTKIAALKEVAKKYPRSLIRSEVKKEEYQSQNYSFDDFEDDMPFQKIPSKDLSEELNNTTDLNLTCFL